MKDRRIDDHAPAIVQQFLHQMSVERGLSMYSTWKLTHAWFCMKKETISHMLSSHSQKAVPNDKKRVRMNFATCHREWVEEDISKSERQSFTLASVNAHVYSLHGSPSLQKPVGRPCPLAPTLTVNHLGAACVELKREMQSI